MYRKYAENRKKNLEQKLSDIIIRFSTYESKMITTTERTKDFEQFKNLLDALRDLLSEEEKKEATLKTLTSVLQTLLEETKALSNEDIKTTLYPLL